MTPLREFDLDALAQASRVLLAADYDGTLAPICPTPELVRTPETVVDTIRRLRATGRVTVAIISGRKLANLAAIAPEADILAGNHGLEMTGALNFIHPSAQQTRPLIAEAAHVLAEATACFRGAWVEDKDLTITIHFRAVEEKARYEVVLAARRVLARFGTALGMRAGKCALEVHPRVRWNKGDALKFIREQLDLTDYPCLCLGDDATDENMFRVVPGQVTVRVGAIGRTLARFQLEHPAAVSMALDRLACQLESGVNPAAAAAG